MATTPLLTAVSSGDALELRPAGSWTASNATVLEQLSKDVLTQLDRAAAVRVDFAGVRELDTLGAWLLEKLSRRVAYAGRRAEIVGIADNYSGLIDEVRQVNRQPPAPAPARNPVIAKLSDIGRATIGSKEDIEAFLQMLGAL